MYTALNSSFQVTKRCAATSVGRVGVESEFGINSWSRSPKVIPEYITRLTFLTENQLLDFFRAPHEANISTYHCNNYIDKK